MQSPATLLLQFLCVLAVQGCTAVRSPSTRSEPTSAPPTTGPAPSQAASEQARLVVVVVIDQLASWVLEQHLERLPEDGALRTGIREGAFHRRAAFSYAATLTAPGHAAVHTGAPPYRSGIMANEVWDRALGRAVPSVWDPQHPVLGRPEMGVSPARLRVPTVGDALKQATGGQARVVSLSVKDRGAALPAGRHADLALWYEPSLPGYTTSTFFAKRLPAWLADWHAQHPIEDLLVPWQPLAPEAYERWLGPDHAPGEGGGWFDATFPHDPRASPTPHAAVLTTPKSSEHLLALAGAAAVELELGADAIPDLLAISISGTDYVGHTFGPESWEYLDNLIRVDRALGALIRDLQARAPTAVLITSDHGVAPLPERRHEAGLDAGRVSTRRVAEALESAADAALGEGDWIEAVVDPFVYFTQAARQAPQRARLVEVVGDTLRATAGIARSFDTQRAAALRQSQDAVERAVGRSLPDAADGDVYLVYAKGWFAGGTSGTSHGTPWTYDTEVPVIFWGAGVTPATSTTPVDQGRIASTVAALLGVAAPSAGEVAPLSGAPRVVR